MINEEDWVVLGRITRDGLNVATIPRESLQQLHDSATIKLCTRAGHADQVLQEQKINIKQLCFWRDEVVTQKQQVEKLVAKACSSAQELEIAEEFPIKTQIHKLATRFWNAKEVAMWIQLDLSY